MNPASIERLLRTFFFAFGVDKDVIEIHHHKDVKFFHQDLINIALESGQYIGQSKRHYLILEIAIADFENYLLLITFSNSHLMLGIG